MAKRVNLGKLEEILPIPNLIDIQVSSYRDFLQQYVKPEDRKKQGLQELFLEFFPMPSLDDNKVTNKDKRIHFVSYRISEPTESIVDCLKDGHSYHGTLYATFRVEDVKTGILGPEEEVVMAADLPLMTPSGSFIINGAERVLVSQLHRSPGICFERERNNAGEDLYSFRIIPDRGSWMEAYIDNKKHIMLSLDRKKGTKKKCLLSTFLRAIGYTNDIDMLRDAYEFKQGVKLSSLAYGKLKRQIDKSTISATKEYDDELSKYCTTAPVVSDTGKTLGKRFVPMTKDLLGVFEENGIVKLDFIYVENEARYLLNCLEDGTDAKDRRSALSLISQRLHSNTGSKQNEEQDEETVKKTFFDCRYFNLGKVGRFKLNELLHDEYMKMGTDFFESVRNMSEEEAKRGNADFVRCIRATSDKDIKESSKEKDPTKKDEARKIPCAEQFGLDPRDLMAATRKLMRLASRGDAADDIDHLGARRVRPIGEQFLARSYDGFRLLAKSVNTQLQSSSDKDSKQWTASRLLNAKTYNSMVRDFFARHQLSQFMDQTNPLSEITNKRRLSALGPGGLNRERAGFEVRDVHNSHYGRICPIETPEGPNIGLITSLALYARVNELGFIETPYRKVENGVVSTNPNDVVYLTADKEEKFVIAQANAPLTEEHKFKNPTVMCRVSGESEERPREEVQLMDVSPKQLVSAATCLIPFLEHDDANRALMGANMQRQAVPLMTTEAPGVGTGLEEKVAHDSRAAILAEKDGIVAEIRVVDNATTIQVITTTDGKIPGETSDPEPMVYELVKFLCTNSSTSINQRPRVHTGSVVKVGDLIADGAATDGGELALGKNLLAAYMPWCGYNFEDAIVLSERLVKEDVYTSIHVDVFEAICRETKNGLEEITSDIAGISAEQLAHLGMNGVVHLGTKVGPDDILVGKVTPQGEIEGSPEQKLLYEIFQNSAKEVRDTSLKMPAGKSGVVMDVRIEYDQDTKKQKMTMKDRKDRIRALDEMYKDKRNDMMQELVQRLTEIFKKYNNGKTQVDIYEVDDKGEKNVFIKQNHKMSQPMIKKLASKYNCYGMDECEAKSDVDDVMGEVCPRFERMEKDYQKQKKDLQEGKNMQDYNSKIKRVKVFVASKRKIQVGDKMAGRHGNKGIVSRIVHVEDMPFMPDGRPVDIVLNPLGVPSRMNIGQILETHLGWAARMLGIKVSTPVFDGATESQIIDLMKKGNLECAAKSGENFHWGFRLIAKKPAKTVKELQEETKDYAADVRAQSKELQDRITKLQKADKNAPELKDLEAKMLKVDHKLSLIEQEQEVLNKSWENWKNAKEEWDEWDKENEKWNTLDGKAPVDYWFDETDESYWKFDGKTDLYDGRTGNKFDQRVTVGQAYMLKLDHLVANKIHARATGPYSLVTQQPLGGKAMKGGQRFGEMEVWALEAYGAAHTLQEMLTVKSDDRAGRTRIYDSIIKGTELFEPSRPESFNVLLSEMRGLGYNVEAVATDDKKNTGKNDKN